MADGDSGVVFNIQRFSTRDGPGIRTVVYMKGCGLACRWCHNPESIAPAPEVQYFAERCAGCGSCARVCPAGRHEHDGGGHRFDRAGCQACGACAERCPAEALVLCGRRRSAGEVLALVGRDLAYYRNSHGGLTLSGGEPLLQAGFCRRLLEGAGEAGIHRAVDTALHVPEGAVAAALPLTDLWLVDVKHLDPEAHARMTGADNARILANLDLLAAAGARIWARTPLVAGYNDSPEHIAGVAGRLAAAGVERYELLPYHNFGVNKAASVARPGQAEEYAPPPGARRAELAAILAERGFAAGE